MPADMAKPSKGSSPKRGRPGGFRHHERPPDPAEAADRPLEPKERPVPLDPERHRTQPPHHRLNKPVGEPNPAADSDPYEPNPEAEDPPPAGQFPGPGPEPEVPEDDEPGFAR